MARTEYAIAVGWNVALNAMMNVEQLFGRMVYAPNRQDPVDIYPQRVEVLSGRIYGHGFINHTWPFAVLPMDKLKVIEDTFHTNGTVVAAQVTIYTRLHNRASYARYNAWSILPQPEQDYTYTRGYARNLRWQFRHLTAL